MFFEVPHSFKKDYLKYIYTQHRTTKLLEINKKFRRGLEDNFLGKKSDYISGMKNGNEFSFGFDSKKRIGDDSDENEYSNFSAVENEFSNSLASVF